MNLNQAQDIIDGYASWWRNEVVASQAGDAIQLVCPMLNRNNDHMSFYIADDPTQPGGLLLTDMGATLSDFAFSGCDILGSESRSRKLEQTLNSLGVMLSGNELCAQADEATLFTQMNMLMQGMASVDDLFFTVKDNVRGFFLPRMLLDGLMSKGYVTRRIRCSRVNRALRQSLISRFRRQKVSLLSDW